MPLIPTPDLLRLAYRIVQPHVTGHVEDSEEYADVCTALVEANFNPDKGAFSTFAYLVGRRAINRGRARRYGLSVKTVNQLDGFDAEQHCEELRLVDVRDEYKHVVNRSRLNLAERECLCGDRDDKHIKHNAVVKLRESAERRQLDHA